MFRKGGGATRSGKIWIKGFKMNFSVACSGRVVGQRGQERYGLKVLKLIPALRVQDECVGEMSNKNLDRVGRILGQGGQQELHMRRDGQQEFGPNWKNSWAGWSARIE